tara:strand:- start:332 stop:520 length:189 start_codon:yes stop_codon:yes gene_type:complete
MPEQVKCLRVFSYQVELKKVKNFKTFCQHLVDLRGIKGQLIIFLFIEILRKKLPFGQPKVFY